MMPKIRATTSSVPAFDQPLAAGSVIPDTAQVATPRAAAETSTRSRNLMVPILREFGGFHLAGVGQVGGPPWPLGWRPFQARRMTALCWRGRRDLPWPLAGHDVA